MAAAYITQVQPLVDSLRAAINEIDFDSVKNYVLNSPGKVLLYGIGTVFASYMLTQVSGLIRYAGYAGIIAGLYGLAAQRVAEGHAASN